MTPQPATPHADGVDGRRARRTRNEEAVVDAYLELVRSGVPHPSIAEVAERSGVSHRSVFRYFADREELTRTAIERQQAYLRPLLGRVVSPDQPFAERVREVLDHRLDLYEAMAPVARLARSLVLRQPLIAAQLTATRQFLRSQLESVFAPELGRLPARTARQTLAALDVLTSFEAVELLRGDHGLSRREAAAVLDSSICALLGTGGSK